MEHNTTVCIFKVFGERLERFAHIALLLKKREWANRWFFKKTYKNVPGKTILVKGEQGLGDTIQFSRYLKLLAQQGAKVILDIHKPLVSLLSSLDGVYRTTAYEDPLPEFDHHCSLLSLPFIFKTEIDAIPKVARPIKIPKAKSKFWSQKLGKKTKMRVGLVWGGSASHRKDHLRSIPLTDFAQYLPPNYEYVCLQKDIKPDDLKELQSHPEILHFESAIEDFLDTAALCQEMDLIISVDTSVAHLAGTLEKEVWILLQYVPDFRWQLQREDTPWYPTAKLLRQEEIDNWKPVLEKMQKLLLAK